MQITGYLDYSQFESAMKNMPKDINRELRGAMKAAADVVVNNAKRLAPVDTGGIRRSIRSRRAQYNRGRVMDAMVYEIHVGAEYAGYQEFGTPRRPMKFTPFLRPALAGSRAEIAAIFEGAVKVGIGQNAFTLIVSGLNFEKGGKDTGIRGSNSGGSIRGNSPSRHRHSYTGGGQGGSGSKKKDVPLGYAYQEDKMKKGKRHRR